MNPSPYLAARRAAALLPPAISIMARCRRAAGVTWICRPSVVDGFPREQRRNSASDSSATCPARAHVDPEVLVFLGAMADSERVGDPAPADDVQNADFFGQPDRIPKVMGTAASRMASCLVRAAIADARICGAGRCPSSVA